jgi:AraC family ethanolamine operon transcriptional activator
VKDAVPFCLHQSFDVFEELSETVAGWDIDFNQVDCGRFHAELFQVGTDSLLLTRASFSRAFEQRGSTPPGLRTFAVPADPDQHFSWRGREVFGSNLLLFPLGAELYAISKPGFNVFTLSYRDDRLSEIAEEIGLPEIRHIMRRTETLTPEPDAYEKLRSLLHRIHRTVTHSPSTRFDGIVLDELEYEIPRLLIMSLHSSQVEGGIPSESLRHYALKKALSYISMHPKRTTTVRDLAMITHVSERTLELAFQERYAMTPKFYMKSVRLNGVHRELWNADRSAAKITDVANRWGFWHMGQFAKDYRRFFGELPSDTLHARSG